MFRMFNNKKGAAFPVTIFVIIGIMLMFGILLTSLQNEVRARVAVEERTKARYLAEAGAEHLLYHIRYGQMEDEIEQLDTVIEEQTMPNVGTYRVLYYPDIEREYNFSDNEIFRSIGTNENGRSMIIEITVRENSVLDWKEIFD